MSDLKKRSVQFLGYVGITVIAFLGLNWINELVFARLEHSSGVNWVFLPAGIRLLATLLFGLAGFIGLLLASLYLNFYHFSFPDPFRAIGGAVAASIGPYLAYLFAKHWFDLGPCLRNLTAQRLLFTGVLCALVNPVFNHALRWVQSGVVDWSALTAMITGDIVGILIVLYLAKGFITLTDPRDVEGPLY
jgi:hypothetical protein